MSLFNRIMSSESDVHMHIGQLLKIMRETRPDDFIYFLCDMFGFVRPERKQELTPEARLKMIIDEIKAKGLEASFRNVL